MTHDQVQKWLDGYIEAWESHDADTIGALFTEDASYSYRPWEDHEVAVKGREAIVAAWLRNEEDPESWDAHYEPYVVEGNKAVAIGWSRYAATETEPERTYHNAYLLEFDDEGHCSSFREFYMQER